ncbi:glutamate synthase [NADH] [Elasticomyces elasticus]|uniref:glutamate synthase (NADH) n=1 Tax=Exophiala sideris TaxID=1016849 RepID=A0ABR0JGC9_9EURO|nr:glutamate synthase [NADH] [Elasticomyces elasticus]KAK5033185.1 glutamate synthase [NADH] [Exophiala sideris]KAK5042315.1 glutamate synthase [NADH] [Exophiala sideris]KAK5063729.1 glutamate synthase [NADH] [Exophiala sideris]KAK5185582.1 glutamate synthase [NADH] [Eurotiomycetes sp. CCFEE 6388]
MGLIVEETHKQEIDTPEVQEEYTPYKPDKGYGWGEALPEKQGLYDPSLEKDACGVGFAANIKGKPSHKIVSDARNLLCNMTHRGAVGSDARDGDGAGVMTSIPHKFFVKNFAREVGVELPPLGQYAAGNLFFKPDTEMLKHATLSFEETAQSLGLRTLGWREVPRDSALLGPAALSREPIILQPFVVLASAYGSGNKPDNTNQEEFDDVAFEKKLYVLRKTVSHDARWKPWFYVCSLSNRNIVYKGQLAPVQVYQYFHDLVAVDYEAHFALVHSRFSTNTFPSWDRSQPLRWLAHNGEINTLRGNKNWMRAREGILSSDLFGEELEKLIPIIEDGGSDSAAFDNVLELLVMNRVLSMPEAVMMMVPEAWQGNNAMDPGKAAFYEYAANLMEPWDGPALFTFSDGRYCGANLDRNGLRPCRYYVTDDDRIICASEVGTIAVEPERVILKGRLQPGKMLLVDTQAGRIIDDAELKATVANRQPFQQWLDKNLMKMPRVVEALSNEVDLSNKLTEATIQEDARLKTFGYSFEQVSLLLAPMAADSKEALGSMGNDAPLACLAQQPRLLYEYFRQLFAQVTNPPIDPIREAMVMSLECYVGPQGNLLEMDESQCGRLLLPSPVLETETFNALKNFSQYNKDWTVRTIDITFDKSSGIEGFMKALDDICDQATAAIDDGDKIIILSDRATSEHRVSVPTLLATGLVHHHLVRNKWRSRVALIVESAEAREVHHMCVLLGYGADGINPYLAIECILKLNREGIIKKKLSEQQLIANYKASCDGGILKVMSKMGISTLQSYKGAQIFEALGIDDTVVDRCFAGTATRVRGMTFELIAEDSFAFHEQGYPSRHVVDVPGLPETGEYHWRDGGEHHINDPVSIANIQDAVRTHNDKSYEAYSLSEYEQIKNCTLRGMLDFDFEQRAPVPIDQVEPWTEIVRRFVTGAMSYGSISMEAHSTLAVAMNRLGGKSNTGEGGEDPERSLKMENGDSMRSAIKQIASGRFGVTSNYLADSDELQIKMAQGAKPGEGGELPGHKVSESIARTRHSTPGVGLISPPPHHDIYSIEDLKQLIYDLKCSNPRARVSVKLVSEVGVGIVAAGVAKAKADHILISGHDGGTGASRWTGIKYAGLPWELGLAETHQTLVLNDLRGRVIVQTDGQIRTGRDVAIACLLGAEEWGFATTPLIAMGCIMMRKCHLNTCPVGIATQDPLLRKKFLGTPEHVINFFYYIANELRAIMAQLGMRTVNEMVGRAELLKVRDDLRSRKTENLDLSLILTPAHSIRPGVATYNVRKQDHKLHTRLDNKLISESELALEKGLPCRIETDIVNTDRALGATLSYQISKRYGETGLPQDTIHVNIRGSAGQSFGAYLAPGVTLELEGDSNDYVGKGLSGGRLIVYPPRSAVYKAEENILIGNVCLYGATSGTCYFRGVAAERFAVRNSGANAVVEGVGDHGCEYMTGGRIVILGGTGRNFAAGMSGGIAYVLDMNQDFHSKINMEMVEVSGVEEPAEIAFLRGMIEDHHHYTGSELAARILLEFNRALPRFVKVLPTDYKRVLAERAQQAEEAKKAEYPLPLLPGNAVRELHQEQLNNAHEQEGKQKKAEMLDIEEGINGDADQAKSKAALVLDKTRGFMKYSRRAEKYRNAKTRVKDWGELSSRLNEDELKYQAARCMDCGVPFCQSDTGCPISNIIPKWNELVFQNQWKDALNRLLMTNNFPEFTGRVCPAPCEGACVLGINEDPVGIKSIECAIIDKGFEMGWMVPNPPEERTGKKVAVIGSGPAGLATADQLNKVGHSVTVYEKSDRAGGLLMYGIPNMKLDKRIVQRRVDLMAAEGVKFVTGVMVGPGEEVSLESLRESHDAVVISTGAQVPRDLKIKNRESEGIHFAMEFLHANTKSLLDSELGDEQYITAKDKHVIVIGGGDTGNDCIGTSLRHGAKSITNFELLPQPPPERARDNPWPQWPRIYRVDYGHTEVKQHYGKDPREYCVMTKDFDVKDGRVVGINTNRVEWTKSATGAWEMKPKEGSEEYFPADLVLLSMGFLGPDDRLFNSEVELDPRKNIKTPKNMYNTNLPGVFAAGDCRRGQSLIVWGINEGRQCARQVDSYLMHTGSILPVTGGIVRRAAHDAVPPPRQSKAEKEGDMAHSAEEFKRGPDIKASA